MNFEAYDYPCRDETRRQQRDAFWLSVEKSRQEDYKVAVNWASFIARKTNNLIDEENCTASQAVEKALRYAIRLAEGAFGFDQSVGIILDAMLELSTYWALGDLVEQLQREKFLFNNSLVFERIDES